MFPVQKVRSGKKGRFNLRFNFPQQKYLQVQILAQIHVARATCRRAEREVADLVRAGECVEEAARYLNRLSDFLFTISRVASKVEQKEETIYTRPDKEGGTYQPSGNLWKKKS